MMPSTDNRSDEFPTNSIGTPSVAINWFRSAPWWRVLKLVLNLSWRSSHILLCCAGLLVTELCVRIINDCFHPEIMLSSWIQPSQLRYSPFAQGIETGSPSFLGVWAHYLSPLFCWIHQQTLRTTASSLAMVLCIMAIWSFIGGCLTRRTVVECGTGMTAPWLDTFRLVAKRWQSFLWGTLVPIFFVAMLALIPALLGLVSRTPWMGWLIATVLLVPLLLLLFPIAWLASGAVFGFPLSVSAIVTERKPDGYEGFSRALSQIRERPIFLLVLIAIGQFLSVAASEFFGSIIYVGRTVLLASFELGASHEMVSQQSILLVGIPTLIVCGFGFSFFWSFSSVMYLLIRRDINGTEYDVIDIPTQENVQARPSIAENSPQSPSALPGSSDASTDVG